jgi:hypothetical protein
MPEDYCIVTSKDEFLNLIFDLLDENYAVASENDSAYAFLQALAAWLQDADGFYANRHIEMATHQANWQLLADMLQAARHYE